MSLRRRSAQSQKISASSANSSPHRAIAVNIIYLYIARGLTFTHTNPDDDEYLEIEKIPLQKAVDMVLAGEIPDGKTQALVLRTAEMLRREGDR